MLSRPNNIPELVGDCFGNSNAITNGELWFLNKIQNNIKSVYDVGASDNSIYVNFLGEVHYFEPTSRIHSIGKTKNSKSYFNTFGLSDETSDSKEITWETSGVLPQASGEILYTENADRIMKTKAASDYMIENEFEEVDFVSIDTEGHELQVLKGFKDFLYKVKTIQFEYGDCTYACGISLNDIISYLLPFGFRDFSYLAPTRLEPINWNTGFKDHYGYCNIVCFNERYDDIL